MSAARTGTSGAPTGPTPAHRTRTTTAPTQPELVALLAAVRGAADADGLVAVGVRGLAGALGSSTVATRRRLAALEREGALVSVGTGVLALPGSRAAALEAHGDDDVAARTPPHDAIHEGTGSPFLW